MSKNSKKGVIYLPLIITAVLFVVFNDEIRSQPDEAGFWIILTLGMSIGIIMKSLFKK